MIRWALIYLVLLGILAVGMRDWFKALCGLLIIAVLQEQRYFHDPFWGVAGLHVINLMLPVVLWQWWMQRKSEGLRWDPPPFVRWALVAYVLVLMYGVAVCLPDFSVLAGQGVTVASFGYNEVVAPLIPLTLAAMLYDGARTRGRMIMAMLALVMMGAIAGAYIVKIIPVSSLLDPKAVLPYRLRIEKEFGLHPNDAVSILVPGMWIAACCMLLMARRLWRLLLAGGILVMGMALLLTQSRTGMLALVSVSLVLALMRSRKLALGVIVAGVAVYFALPSISANWSRGTSIYVGEGQATADLNEMTSGRIELWQSAWRDISEAPLMGHGIRWWSRSWTGNDETVDCHPHNAYLEIWMGYGLFALLVVIAVFLTFLVVAVRMLRKGASRLELAAGLGATACVLTHFVVGMGTRAFLPRVSAIITFCMLALAMRVYVSGRTLPETRPAPSGRAASGSPRRHGGHGEYRLEKKPVQAARLGR